MGLSLRAICGFFSSPHRNVARSEMFFCFSGSFCSSLRLVISINQDARAKASRKKKRAKRGEPDPKRDCASFAEKLNPVSPVRCAEEKIQLLVTLLGWTHRNSRRRLCKQLNIFIASHGKARDCFSLIEGEERASRAQTGSGEANN